MKTQHTPEFDPRHIEGVDLTAFLHNTTDCAEEILEQLEDRYDGAPDSKLKWLSIAIKDQRGVILALKRAQSIATANARLIAAAPETAAERDRLREANAELAKALKEYVDRQEAASSNPRELEGLPEYEQARAAIAKHSTP